MNNLKSVTMWIIVFFLGMLVVMKLLEGQRPVSISVTELLTLAATHQEKGANSAFDGTIEDKGGKIEGVLASGVFKDPSRPANAPVPFVTEYHELQSPYILSKMMEYGVRKYKAKPGSPLLGQIFLSIILPIVLIGALWLLFIRQIQSTGNKAMSFGKSRAKLVTEGAVKVTFDDVAGVDEAKEELREVVEFLKDPKKFSRLGGKIPKGVLLYGPPGTGKTLLAKAVAGEANVPFFSISGSDFVEMFVGVGASRVRDLFEQAKKSKPCLVFIDEIDAVGRHRFAGIGGGHDEREQTLNQLLVEMDGFATNEGVILVAATNRPDVLDPALLRPGRFDRQITVDYPDVVGREKILKVHSKTVKLATGVDLKSIARGTPGYSGADLANIINEAALLAARCNKSSIEQQDLEEAKDRVMMGPERRSLRIVDEEKRETAIHEAGHAIAAHFTPGCDPIHKITIMPRGRSLGLTASLPAEEKHNTNRSELKARLVSLLGGMAAEKLVLSQTGTGVGNDLVRVTSLARKMICEFGMSNVLGPRTFGENNNQVFLGKDLSNEGRNYSEELARQIDAEVKALVDEAFSRASGILNDHRDALDRLTHALIERETISAEEFLMLVEGQALPPLFKTPNDDPKPTPSGDAGEREERKKPKAPRLGDILEGPRQVAG